MGTTLDREGWPEHMHVVSLTDVARFLGHLLRLGVGETELHNPDHYGGASELLDQHMVEDQ